MVKQSVLICRELPLATSPLFIRTTEPAAHSLAHTQARLCVHLCVYVVRITLLMFSLCHQTEEGKVPPVPMWATFQITRRRDETQMGNLLRNVDANKLFKSTPFFFRSGIAKLWKWNTALLLHPTAKSGLVPLRDSSPGATGRIFTSSGDFPN